MAKGLSDFLASFEEEEKEDSELLEESFKQSPKPKEVPEDLPPKEATPKAEGTKPIKLKLNIAKVQKEPEAITKKETQKVTVESKPNPKPKPRTEFDPMNPERLERLFKESETSPSKKEEWLGYYEKGCRSKKRTETVRKLITGRFRILDSGDIEILPDLRTRDKSVQELFKTKWI